MKQGCTGPVAAALLLLGPLAAQAQEQIGTIIVTKGQVSARAADGSVRTLARRSSLFAQDTVLTGSDGFVNVRLIDNAQLALGTDTEFSFDAYRFDGDPVTPDVAVMSMVRGCFRTVSGSIDNDMDEYRIDTPFASIGINGTYHEAAVTEDALYTRTFEGGTTVSNNRGHLVLGMGGNYDYSRTLARAAPEGLVTYPDELDCQSSPSAAVNNANLLSPPPTPDYSATPIILQSTPPRSPNEVTPLPVPSRPEPVRQGL